ncbi:MAG: aminotransferase class I/II-fold pyridoxal phosphate-dependent enzyme, partial [Pseudonocardia sp.]|nr:aminotransferase class I/II-fold pyridoxal phosphate-dependent enzyme [Pseudonocardia sp.]
RFHPYLTLSADAAATGIALHSASKAWNLAGLKCALVVAADPRRLALLTRLPDAWTVGHLGVLAATAAYRDAEPWLDSLLDAIAGNVELLGELLARHLPEVTCTPPEATYLAWLDCRALGLGDDPAAE